MNPKHRAFWPEKLLEFDPISVFGLISGKFLPEYEALKIRNEKKRFKASHDHSKLMAHLKESRDFKRKF